MWYSKKIFFLILPALGRQYYAKYSAMLLSSQNLLRGTKLKTSLKEILQDMYIACFVKPAIFLPELSGHLHSTYWLALMQFFYKRSGGQKKRRNVPHDRKRDPQPLG